VVQYALASELAAYLQSDVDTASANQALTLASGEFSAAADTWFAAQSVTWVTTGTRHTNVILPFKPVTAIDEVRINGVAVTGWTLINSVLYRAAGFGSYSPSVPDLLEVDLTHGYTTVPDDVKLAVLEIASGMYSNPTSAVSERIDDYTVRYDPNYKIVPGRPWRDVAAAYRGSLIA
jgi:hypothetical protein